MLLQNYQTDVMVADNKVRLTGEVHGVHTSNQYESAHLESLEQVTHSLQ